MLMRSLNTIDEFDLVSLVAEAVAEGKTLEYKRELPGGKDDDKREFLADV